MRPLLAPATVFFAPIILVEDSNGDVDTLPPARGATLGSGRRAMLAPGESLVPNMMLVNFAPGTASFDSLNALGVALSHNETADVFSGLGLRVVRSLFRDRSSADTLVQAKTGEMVRIPDLSTWCRVEVPSGVDVSFAANALRALASVRGATPEHLYATYVLPNDPLISTQGYVTGGSGPHVSGAWDITTGRPDVRIGIVDTGVDYTHPDLDPGNRTHIVPGGDYADNDNDPMDDNNNPETFSHGTAVAGVAGAMTNNGLQIAGIGWHCTIHPLKAAWSSGGHAGQLWEGNIAEAIDGARAWGDDVINISIGTAFDSEWWEDAFLWFTGNPIAQATYAAYRAGCTVVSAVGNEGQNLRSVPAGLDWVMGVGSTAADSSISIFSNHGEWVDVVTLGEGMRTTWRGGGLEYEEGTSLAAPVVSGAAALMVSAALDSAMALSNDDIMALLRHTARDRGAPGPDDFFGYGLLDARAAVQRLRPPYSTLRAAPTGGSATRIAQQREVVLLERYGDIDPGHYWADVYEVSQHVTFPLGYQGVPLAWGRGRETVGLANSNPVDFGYCAVRNVTATSCDVVTYCYTNITTIFGHQPGWVPCPPAAVRFAYTVNGIVPLQNAAILGPDDTCVPPTFTLNHAGGSGVVTYAWRWRPSETMDWSGTVSTQKTYNATWSQAGTYVVEATATNNGVTATDTHTVNFAPPCVVGVEAAPIAELGISCSPNPIVGRGQIMMRMPSDAQVSLECFDVSGRIVGRKDSGILPAGEHAIEWIEIVGGDALARGIYFLRVRVGNEIRSLRVALMD